MSSSAMMLTIDTTSDHFGLALSCDGQILAHEIGKSGRTLDVDLFTRLNHLLSVGSFDLADVQSLSVCIGPGSFIGTRIGLSVANTLSVVMGIPAIGVGLLPALAFLAVEEGEEKEVVAAVNCVRDEFFYQRFVLGSTVQSLGPIGIARPAELVSIAAGQTIIARLFEIGRKAGRASAETLPCIVPDYRDLLFAIITLSARAQLDGDAGGASLPAPIYVKSGDSRS